jgi:hypothetical protein
MSRRNQDGHIGLRESGIGEAASHGAGGDGVIAGLIGGIDLNELFQDVARELLSAGIDLRERGSAHGEYQKALKHGVLF